MNNANGQKLTILYERLSKEDSRQDESLSIENQKKILENYAAENGFAPFLHLSDDGATGANFNRPGWQELIAKVESGEVGTILIKTLDRMGRDYLRAGLYREMFKTRGVRLIAVGDNFDSDTGNDDLTPFREIMAEWFARDTSNKIKAVLRSKGKDGKPLGTTPLYGYRKSPDDKNVRIIDDEAAGVVGRIFRMTVDGKGPHQIAKTLMDEKVERPSYYLVRAGIVENDGKCNYGLRYNWRGNTVATILQKREYMGDLVNFKSRKPSFKSKKQVKNAPEDMMVFEGAMPAIVDRDTWQLAQKLRRVIRRPAGNYEPNPLTGLLICADCGGRLHNRRSDYTTDKNGNKINPVDTYECENYRKNAAKFVDVCSIHFIRTSVVRDLILAAIRKVSTYAREHQTEFVAKLRADSEIRQADAAKSHRKTLAKNEKRIAELDTLFIKIYEDNSLGKLSDERFQMMSEKYETEQSALKAQTAALQAEVDAYEADSHNAERFLELVRRYTEFDELTTPMINSFVDKVVVHEADKSSGERRQKVDICLNFVGNFTVPGDEPRELTPEEQAAEEERLAKKRRKNENLRTWRSKRKAAKKQASEQTIEHAEAAPPPNPAA